MNAYFLLFALCMGEPWTAQQLKSAYDNRRFDNLISLIDNKYLSPLFVERLQTNLEKNLQHGVVFLYIIDRVDKHYYCIRSGEWELDRLYADWLALFGAEPPFKIENMVFLLISIEDRKYITQLGKNILAFVPALDLESEIKRNLPLIRKRDFEGAIKEIFKYIISKVKHLEFPATGFTIPQKEVKVSSDNIATLFSSRSSAPTFYSPELHSITDVKEAAALLLSNLKLPEPELTSNAHDSLQGSRKHSEERDLMIYLLGGSFLILIIIIGLIYRVRSCSASNIISSEPDSVVLSSEPPPENNGATFTLSCGHSFGGSLHPKAAQWNSCPVCYRPVVYDAQLEMPPAPSLNPVLKSSPETPEITKHIIQTAQTPFSTRNHRKKNSIANLAPARPAPKVNTCMPQRKGRTVSPRRKSGINWPNAAGNFRNSRSNTRLITTAIMSANSKKPFIQTQGTMGGW